MRALACLFAVASALLGAASQLPAAASGAGVVTVGPVALAGSAQVSPGDRISAGYDLAFAGGHPLATVHVSVATATLALSCKQNASPSGQLLVALVDGSYTVASGDVAWHATASQADHAGYQGAAVVPDVCGGSKTWVDTNGAAGVTYSAALDSADTHDAIRVRFHAVDAAANCADAAQNPSPGVRACDAAWSLAASTTAAPTPGSTSGSGTGAPTPGPTPPATGSIAPAVSPGAPTSSPPPTSGRTTHAAPPSHSSSVAGIATHRPLASAVGTTLLAASSPRPALTPGDVPLTVVVAPPGSSGRAVAAAPSPLPVARLASVLGALPVPALAAIAGGDLLLAVALIVRRCTRQIRHMNGGLPDVQAE